MGCSKLTYQNFSFLEVVHRKKATAKFIFGLNGDHLGNIRLTYADSDNDGSIHPGNEIIEENNYYPFGLKHKGYNGTVSANSNSVASKFMFGGKEYGEELGLDWYDVSARNYDPALGRWMNLDPLAEKMRRHSPYNFGFDNPVYFQDYDGMAPRGPGRKALQKALAAASKKAKLLKAGRRGKQARLRRILTDPKASKSDKGWVKQEINQMKRGKRTGIRNPPGKELAHERGREAAKGYSYEHSNLQDKGLHDLQHKYDNKGKLNKERPVEVMALTAATGSIDSESPKDELGSEVVSFAADLSDTVENFGVNVFGDNAFGNMIDTFNPLSLGFSDLFKFAEEGSSTDNTKSTTKSTTKKSTNSNYSYDAYLEELSRNINQK